MILERVRINDHGKCKVYKAAMICSFVKLNEVIKQTELRHYALYLPCYLQYNIFMCKNTDLFYSGDLSKYKHNS